MSRNEIPLRTLALVECSVRLMADSQRVARPRFMEDARTLVGDDWEEALLDMTVFAGVMLARVAELEDDETMLGMLHGMRRGLLAEDPHAN